MNKFIFCLSILLYFKLAFAQVESPFPYCQKDPNPIGGGASYLDIIEAKDCQIHIKTFEGAKEFKWIVENARAGTKIYIEDSLTIDLTGLASSVNIPAGITLASGRGLNSGACIKTDDMQIYKGAGPGYSMFNINGDSVRITGLRIEGPFKELGSATDGKMNFKPGISSVNSEYLEVDNCELFGWPYAAIRIGNVKYASLKGNRIHHNYIHHNQQNRLGYGVSVDNGFVSIYSNIFEANRHDIAGSGKKQCGYEAFCNTVLSGGVSHNFDMHAEGVSDKSPNAGRYVFIHHNDFQDKGGFKRTLNNDYNIMVRGRPDVQCRIENNRFAHKYLNRAINQRNTMGGFGNMLIWNNILNENEFKGWYVSAEWGAFKSPNHLLLHNSIDPLLDGDLSDKIPSNYQYTFGDIEGDGKTDIFKVENDSIWVLPFDCNNYFKNEGFMQSWRFLGTTTLDLCDLQFGFFDGKAGTDILSVSSDSLLILNKSTHQWNYFAHSEHELFEVKSAFATAHRQNDLIYSDGKEISVSIGAKAEWEVINQFEHGIEQFTVGHFNQDNVHDILITNGAAFYVSYSCKLPFEKLSDFNEELSELAICDFNGDGISDLIILKNRKISLGGTEEWIPLTLENFNLALLQHYNF